MVGGQEMFDFSTLDGLRAWRDFVIAGQREHHCSGGCPIGSLGGQLAETDPDARAHVAEGFKRWEATIQSGLREMHARGELTPDTDPDTLALALLAALQGGLLLTQVKRDTQPLEAALDAMLELVTRLSVRQLVASSRDTLETPQRRKPRHPIRSRDPPIVGVRFRPH